MANKETSQPEQKTFMEKTAWWAKVGGVVAGVLGAMTHWMNLTGGGVALFVGGEIVDSQFRKARQNAKASAS